MATDLYCSALLRSGGTHWRNSTTSSRGCTWSSTASGTFGGSVRLIGMVESGHVFASTWLIRSASRSTAVSTSPHPIPSARTSRSRPPKARPPTRLGYAGRWACVPGLEVPSGSALWPHVQLLGAADSDAARSLGDVNGPGNTGQRRDPGDRPWSGKVRGSPSLSARSAAPRASCSRRRRGPA